VPQTTWGKIFTATPVVMAVVATMLAGLASSEMTRAQYARSLGAQQQSKAGDQWGFFQAKRLRGALQRNTLDLLQNAADLHPLDPVALKNFVAQQNQAEAANWKTEMLTLLDSTAGQQALAALQKGEVPGAGAGPAWDPKVKAATEAIAAAEAETQITELSSPVDNQAIEVALRAAKDQAQAFETANQPTTRAIEQLENLLARGTALLQQSRAVPASDAIASKAGWTLLRDFTAARVRYTALRYESEARLNQSIAYLYELQVRKSNLSAERHHRRSQRFFFGMLAAQTGVIISTFAMAARKRNLLWSLAAAAGLLAIAFAIYVYLYV